MFMGEQHHSIDAKGRIVVPTIFREELGSSFVVTKGLDNSLFIYTDEKWKELSDKFLEMKMTDRETLRRFFGGASRVEADANGRVMLPAGLRLFAGLSKEIVSVGLIDRIEIWDKQSWIDYNCKGEVSDDELAETLAQYGI